MKGGMMERWRLPGGRDMKAQGGKPPQGLMGVVLFFFFFSFFFLFAPLLTFSLERKQVVRSHGRSERSPSGMSNPFSSVDCYG